MISLSKERYTLSLDAESKAGQIIPLGSQTFSKSRISIPYGAAPLMLKSGLGSKVIDLDGNEYIDFVSGLLSISIGYADKDINGAIISQLANGISFSLSTALEYDLAKELVDLIPCAEMVRFGKNGTDVTSAAIRLARAYTGRDRVAVCGYHGWQDWYIGSTSRDLGVPKDVKALTSKFKYNDIDSLHQLINAHPGELAAVILEPMTFDYPVDNFLHKVRELCSKNNIVLIFDEMITGFRFSLGGAQELFGVTPDLATFGKGMANGMPLSAIVGCKDIMILMEDIFFSGTFGGETLSLVAGIAVIDKFKRENVIASITNRGVYLMEKFNSMVQELNKPSWISIKGHPSWTLIDIKDKNGYSPLQIKSLLIQELAKQGVLMLGTHNLSFSHTKADIDKLIEVYYNVIPFITDVLNSHTLHEVLEGEELVPVFNVR